MAISYIDGATADSGVASTSVTVTLPVSTAENDYTICAAVDGRKLSDVDITCSWGELADLYANDSSDANLGVFAKVQGATPDTTVTMDGMTSHFSAIHSGLVRVYRGVDTTTPLDATQTTATGIDTGQPTPPAITTSTADAVVVIVAASSSGAAVTNSPSTYGNLVDRQGSASVMSSDKTIASPTTETPGTYTDPSSSNTNSWAACTIALKPAGGAGTDSLLADDIATAAPTVASPALHQVHALNANDVATAAPTAASPALHQAHALLADDVAAAAPTLGTPALSETHPLLADDIATAAPTAGSPALAQVHALAANDVAAAAPTLASPALSQVHALAADDVATAAPTLGTPNLAESNALLADDIAAGVPTVSAPTLAQVHALLADDAIAGAPILSTPALISGGGGAGLARNLSLLGAGT